MRGRSWELCAVAGLAFLGAIGTSAVAAPLPGTAGRVASVTSTAKSDASVMLVVDTSDSMNEDDGSGKRIKIDGARQALIDFVRAIPTTTQLGLRVYPGSGATSDGSGCSLGDATVALGANNLSTVDAKIRQLEASGNTPTGPALQRAAEDLRAAKATQATIVLVSDGQSNCGPDPCEVAGQIAASGIDLTVNTVGFRISDEGRQQLQCISDKTDGLYADADDNAQLSKQLDQLSRPLLDIRLDYPPAAKAAVGHDEQGLVTVQATVTNVGASALTDAQLTFAFAGDARPTVLSPRRRLGNLQPGTTVDTRWQFRPPLLEADQALPFSVTGRGRNSEPVSAAGSIAVTTGVSLDDAGPLLKDAKRIAILGDSYSAGEGSGSYTTGTATLQNGCHRSRLTYAVPLWDAKVSEGYRADVFACSGATSPDLENTNHSNPSEGPQIDHLTRNTAYDAVLMTIGGNDIGFAEIATRCVISYDCNWMYQTKIAEARGLWQALQQDYRTVEGSLNTKKNMAKRGGEPGALIVLAYPNPFPLASRNACSKAYQPMEQRFFQQLVETLSESADKAVAALQAEGLPVYYVPDTIDAFQPDHTYCSSDPYVVKLRAATNLDKLVSPTTGLGQYLTLLGLAYKTKILKSKLLDAEKLELINKAQEQIHPNARGYKAQTVELVRWSTTAAARRPVERTATFLPVTSNPPPDATVQLGPTGSSATTLQPGGVLQVQGAGLPPESMAELQVRSEPVPLDRRLVGDDGRVTFTVRIPRSLPVGRHHIVIQSETESGQTVEFAAPLDVQRLRPWWLILLAGSGALSIAGGFVLWRRSGSTGQGS